MEWLPTLASWAAARGSRVHVSRLPEYGKALGAGFAMARARPEGPFGDLALGSHSQPDGRSVGIVHDLAGHTIAAVIAVASESLALRERSAREERAAAWGRLLASMAKDGTPLASLQWIERRIPTDLAAHEIDAVGMEAGEDANGGRLRAAASYRALLADEADSAWVHESVVVVCVRADALGSMGTGAAAYTLLARYLGSLEHSIRDARIGEPCVLGPLALEGWMRRTWFTSGGLRGSQARSPHSEGVEPRGRFKKQERLIWPWPLAVEVGWSTLRTEGTWHAVYWIAEWPRIGVGPDFLAPLVLWRGARRTLAMTMKAVPPHRAERELERTRTAHLADARLRARGGFSTSVRTEKDGEHVTRRARDLADGHAEYRFSAYMALSADSETELRDACGAVEAVAARCGLELRRLYGRVGEVFTFTLPTGRGVR